MKLTIQKGSLGLGLVLLWVGVLNTGTDSLFYNSLLFPIVGAFLRIGTVLPVLKMLVYLMSTLFALLLVWELIQSGIYSGMISFSIFIFFNAAPITYRNIIHVALYPFSNLNRSTFAKYGNAI